MVELELDDLLVFEGMVYDHEREALEREIRHLADQDAMTFSRATSLDNAELVAEVRWAFDLAPLRGHVTAGEAAERKRRKGARS